MFSLIQCLKLKLELDDANASCELQKGRVKGLLANPISTTIDDDTVHGLGDGDGDGGGGSGSDGGGGGGNVTA